MSDGKSALFIGGPLNNQINYVPGELYQVLKAPPKYGFWDKESDPYAPIPYSRGNYNLIGRRSDGLKLFMWGGWDDED